jgi:hypothetical protein
MNIGVFRLQRRNLQERTEHGVFDITEDNISELMK